MCIPIIYIYENCNILWLTMPTLENACIKVYQCYLPIQTRLHPRWRGQSTRFNFVQRVKQRHHKSVQILHLCQARQTSLTNCDSTTTSKSSRTTIYEQRVHTMLINATPFNDPFLVHPDGPHRLLLPTFFLPLPIFMQMAAETAVNFQPPGWPRSF